MPTLPVLHGTHGSGTLAHHKLTPLGLAFRLQHPAGKRGALSSSSIKPLAVEGKAAREGVGWVLRSLEGAGSCSPRSLPGPQRTPPRRRRGPDRRSPPLSWAAAARPGPRNKGWHRGGASGDRIGSILAFHSSLLCPSEIILTLR